MNNNELMKDLYNVLKTSGWLDKATKYFQEHPERFEDCVYGDGKIANLSMSVSYQSESLSAIVDTKPNVFISISGANSTMYEYNVYAVTNRAKSRTWIDSNLVAETVEDISNV